MTTHLTASPPDDLEVGAWRDLAGLVELLGLLDDRAQEVVRHARDHVCDPDGFQPSPLCVLRPLVPVLRRVEEAFTDLGREVGAQVQQLAGGVVAASAELSAADAAAVAACTPAAA